MTQYKTQYGTIFAVKEHNGAPAIMRRAELSETWSLSSMITPFTPGAWTAEELQGQLDNWAATKGWQPVAEPASACLCETCTCTGCHEDCFGHCKGCGHPVDHCNSYQTEGEKRLRAEPTSAEPPEIVDEGSVPEDGFPDWVRPMVEAFLQFPFFRELPAFTSSALRYSDPARHCQGGTLADGVYDTGPKGITFFVFRGDNSDQYREAHYTWADFVRRCKAAGLAPEPHQDKEDAPCNTEPTAPTGAAAATTDGSAAPQPSQAAETTTTSASGADADTSMSLESGTSGPSTSLARGCPAETGDAASGAKPAASPVTTPSSLPAFDYTGLDAQTVQDLHLAEREFAGGKRMAEIGLRRMADGVAIAHDALCGTDATLCRNGDGTFTAPEKTFGRWCESVGLNRKAAERLLQVSKLFDNSSPRQQKALEELGPTLLYAAAKPSAPAELVRAVKDGDITTHKQYQDLLARYDAEKAAREKAEKAAKAMTECYNAAHKNEEFTLKNMKKARDERDTALRRAAEAEKQRDGARDALAAAKLRGDKLKAENDALKAHPIEAQVVDEEEIDRRAQARADELTAPLREELEALRARHPADLEEAEQAIRDAYDSAIYTGRVMENAWHTLRPLLPRMDAHRRELAIQQVSKTLAQIQGEITACL